MTVHDLSFAEVHDCITIAELLTDEAMGLRAATAADSHNSMAMLVSREGETLTSLLKRLDRAIGRCYETDEPADEINPL
nr:hypothetical protein [Variovorax sp. 770b2]